MKQIGRLCKTIEIEVEDLTKLPQINCQSCLHDYVDTCPLSHLSSFKFHAARLESQNCKNYQPKYIFNVEVVE